MNMTRRPRHLRRASGGRSASRGVCRGFTLIELLIVIGVILLLTALTVTVVTGLTRRSEIRDTESTMRLMEQALSEWELAMGRQVTFGRSNNFTGMANEPVCPDLEPRYELPQLAGANVAAPDDNALRTSDMLWTILSRASSAREIVGRINPDHLIELDPEAAGDPPTHFGVDNLDHLVSYMSSRLGYRFLDAWGNPIIAVMPGRRYQRDVGGCTEDAAYCVGDMPNPNCPDNDGTIRTPYENRFGIAANRRIFFVSAGPSGRFGDLRLHRTQAAISGNDQWQDDVRRADDNIYSHDIIIEEGRPQ